MGRFDRSDPPARPLGPRHWLWRVSVSAGRVERFADLALEQPAQRPLWLAALDDLRDAIRGARGAGVSPQAIGAAVEDGRTGRLRTDVPADLAADGLSPGATPR